MPPGFLAVTSQPSSQLSVDDFHAWYEEEHIPLRLNYLPSFLSGARFKAIDPPESGPGWLAMYEIDDTQAFAQESYTSLRDKRSKREASVMQRLETLTRLAGEQLIVLEGAEARNSTGLKLGQPSRCLITHLLNIAADDEDARNKLATEWADRTSRAGNTIHEYARLRLVKVLESGKTHMGSAVDLQPNEKASYFVGHELRHVNHHSIELLLGLLSAGDHKINNCRQWELYKAYPCIAQGNDVATVDSGVQQL